ncbi:DUF3786 domain-containing protein [Desulfoscipio sp. XC116]|uniref:DUF3786 domain-containing protein n=1 Tax=Desulfoscipio sp. XC116 TaxID=3144975 RepID=UPI00325B9308
MTQIKSPLDIYKLLPKSNCRQCGVRTCLAFADAVFKGNKSIAECPHMEGGDNQKIDGQVVRPRGITQQQEQMLEQLKRDLAGVDLSAVAPRLGGSYADGKLTIKILGKDFHVDAAGNVTSAIHVNTWVTVPLLNYIITGKGKNPSGSWVAFRELRNGHIRQPLFEQRCEKPLQKMAEHDVDLFEHLLAVFGKPVRDIFSSDMAYILYTLPKMPILISCWMPEEAGMEARVNLFFDQAAQENLDIDSIHMLCSGIVTMFEKITARHGK